MTRGDIYVLKPGRASRGHGQQGGRFAVILQSSELTTLSTVVAAPTSLSARDSYLHPHVRVRGQTTRLLVPQLKATDHGRLGRRVGRLSASEIAEVDDALRMVLGLV